MSDITLRAIAKTMEDVLKQELEPVKTRLDSIEKTQSIHTSALEQLFTGQKNREEEKLSSAQPFASFEQVIEAALKK
ncbi:MAG: hypothetical protein AAB410_03195 [Patescibacteria group bacterium]